MGAAISYGVDFEFHITTQNIPIYSFAFDAPSATSFTEIKGTFLDNWEVVDTGGNTDLIIIKERTDTSRVLSASDTPVYFGKLSQGMTNAPQVYWVSSKSGNEFNSNITTTGTASDVFTNWSTVNDFPMTYNAGDGGGDPHINPIINPYNTTLILPSNTKIYNYLYFQDQTETIIINAQMHQLSHDRIVFAEELQRDLSFTKKDKHKHLLATPEKRDILPQALNNITLYPQPPNSTTENDPSFIKTLYVYYQNKQTNTEIAYTINMETLDIQSQITSTSDQQNISFTEKTPLLRPKIHEGKIKFERSEDDSYERKIKFTTVHLKNFDIYISRDTHRLNHRNNIHVKFFSPQVYKKNIHSPSVKGALIHPDRIYTLPTLETTDQSQFQKEPIPEILSDYKNRNAKRLKRLRFQIRDMVRAHDFSLLSPPQ